MPPQFHPACGYGSNALTGGTAPTLTPLGAIWLAGRNSLTDGAAVKLDPETVPFGIQTLTCDFAWTKPHVGAPTDTVTDPLFAVSKGVVTVKV